MARHLIKKVLDFGRTGIVAECATARPVVTSSGCSMLSSPGSTRPCSPLFQKVRHLHVYRDLRYSGIFGAKFSASINCRAKLNSGIQKDTAVGGSCDEIVTFIRDDDDLERFLGHVAGLLQMPAFSKVRIAQEEAQTKLDALARRLLDMRANPRNVFSFLQSNPKVLDANWEALISALQFLDGLQLQGNRVLLALDRNPRICGASAQQLQERVRKLRKLGLVEGSLQRVITTWPGILTLRKKTLNAAVEMLRKCQFSSRQITSIIISSPQILGSEPADIEHRFQYVYFAMGLTNQADMVQANLFKYTLEHIRCRHTILDRLGIYEMPDKHGKTRRDNPKLARIIDCTDTRFAEKCAGIPPEEFETFRRSLEEVVDEVEGDEDEVDETLTGSTEGTPDRRW